MNVLLDTHFILWFAQGDKRLPADLRSIIEDPANGVFASEVSVLEIAIKHAKNPSAMPYSAEEFTALCDTGGFELRPLTRESIFAYGSLAFDKVGDLHKDPFDRMLIHLAIRKNLVMLSRDHHFKAYEQSGLQLLW